MPKKKQVTLAQMKIGIFTLVAFILLSALILHQSWGIRWFSDSVQILTYLPDVGGLKPGSPVWLAGIEIGKVRSVNLIAAESYHNNQPILDQIREIRDHIKTVDTTSSSGVKLVQSLEDEIRSLQQELRMVEVRMDIQKQYLPRIGPGSDVSIASRGLIGDSFIDITPGISDEPPPFKDGYYVIESIQTPGFREIMRGANDVIANFGVLSERVQNIAAKISPDKIGTDISDTVQGLQQAIQAAETTFNQATLLFKDMHNGQGTLGKIINDPSAFDSMTAALEKFNSFAEKIQSGDGTLAKFVNDPSVYDAANSTLGNADKILKRMEMGEGTLGKLSTDDALYERTRRALDNFASLVEEIERGEGTLGKLLKDPGLYDNLEQSSSEVTKLLYDLRQDPKKYLTIRFRLF
jgi:phospholipid/cholesterol/gamma-HCH transport system substrate-binding protein